MNNLPDDWGRYPEDANFGAGKECEFCHEVHGLCEKCEAELSCDDDLLCEDCENNEETESEGS